jgi:hypothetical protein
MALKAEFDVAVDLMVFTTQKNGDKIKIQGVHLGAETAANLATLINAGNTLTVIVKEKVV